MPKKRVTYQGSGKILLGPQEWVATHVEWENEEDSYEEGLIGNSFIAVHESINIRAKTPSRLLALLQARYDLPDDKEAWSASSDGLIMCEFMVDENNFRVDNRDIDRWKLKQQRLWAARVEFLIELVTVQEPAVAELAKAFGIADIT